MTLSQSHIDHIRYKYEVLLPCLDEKGRRLWAATEAISYGRGGIALVCKATGMSNTTIHKGIKEINDSSTPASGRVRHVGGGRKSTTKTKRGLRKALISLVEPTAKGDPMSPLKWTSKSTRNIADALAQQDYSISHATIGSMLHQLGYSLQVNKKTIEGSSHVDRDAQFRYINDGIMAVQKRGQPAISVDTKKKENIGNYKNEGKEFCKKGRPIEVETHDFPDKRLGKVIPYGIYDIGKNKGWVSVGVSSDTAEFAVNSIRTWWYKMGSEGYPDATEIFVTADCGGSNSYRARLWKVELQRLADELQMIIHVHHFPPGTSKWNKIEHKLFSYISKNWRGQPLLTRETVVNLIANTSTRKGLKVTAVLDENEYKLGIDVSESELEEVIVHHHSFHPEWNYSIIPRPQKIAEEKPALYTS
jgi:Rhodopirellula transposase DDE domain